MIYCISKLRFPQDLSPASVGRQCAVENFLPRLLCSLQLVGSTTPGSSEQQEPFMPIVANRSAPAQPPRRWTVGLLIFAGREKTGHRIVRSWQRRSSHLPGASGSFSPWRFLSRGVRSAVSGNRMSVRVVCPHAPAGQTSLLNSNSLTFPRRRSLNVLSELRRHLFISVAMGGGGGV